LITSQSLTLTGPSLAIWPSEKLFANILPTAAEAIVAKILVLFDVMPVSRAFKDPFKFPFNAESTALATLADCAKLSAAPASIAFMLNDFFALLRGALRLGAMYTH
jgi:hypothetical protein